MSSSNELVSREDNIPLPNQEAPSLLTIISDQKVHDAPKLEEKSVEVHVDDEQPEKEKSIKKRIVYTIEELLDIKAGMQKWNLERPSVLEEEFVEKKCGKWDPEAWSQSDSSRAESPLVADGKPVVSEGKSLDLFGIKLEPKRDSFKQGCKVKTEKKPYADKTQRLTGRSSYQRSVPTNYRDGDSISASSYEFERLRKKDRETIGSSREKYDHSSYSDKQPYRRHQHVEESTPEWMSDDPMPKGDNCNFFNSHFEEEKKAYAAKAKKKKVRISPDVDVQMEEKRRGRSTSIPSPKEEKPSQGKKFDINAFMKDVEYFPPERFTEDDNGVRSKFTKFFQNQKKTIVNSRNSTSRSPAGGVLIPDNVIAARPVSPAISQALFAPIQPAPALVSAAANAHVIQSSNIANIIEMKRHEHLLENLHQSKKEVRGSLSVQELEGSKGSFVPSHPMPSYTQTDAELEPEGSSPGANAFNLLLQSMKDAGQLPDKPSPVVSGLPGHLLPHPPTRTSPVFEKLKRTLSRSPSPKDFAKAVSTVASIISSHPSIDKELAVLKQSRVTSENDGVVFSVKKQSVDRVNSPKTPTQLHMRNSTASPSQTKKTPLNAFTPTSVLKKMHNERKDDNVSKSDGQNDDFEKKNLDSQFMDVATTPDRIKPDNDLPSKFMPFHSAPVTPKNYFSTASTNTMSVSAPGTPNPKSENDPPALKRIQAQPPGIQRLNDQHIDSIFEKLKGSSQGDKVLMAPSAFKALASSNSQNSVGVIGSGIRHPEDHDNNVNNQLAQMNISSGKVSPRQMFADPKLAPGNGVRHNQNHDQMNYSSRHSPLSMPKPQSQQQQLLQAQRMAQIQQAQLLQQQKLQEIAKLGRQGNPSQEQAPGNFRPMVTEADKSSSPHNFPPQRRLQQQQQQQQLLSYQQQQHLYNQHQQRPFLPVNSFQQNQPRVPGQLPIPPMQSQLPGFQPYQQPQINPVNFAAQALVQQQLINQAARARLLAQATLFQQRPQVMQAALMAQAALVRGQAQAQAAMMLNPRNLQVMAEQMGLRQPFNASKQHRKPGSNASSPIDAAPNETVGRENGDDNILSKWFSNDVLQQTKTNSDIKNAKILSVEELEKSQR